MTEMLYWHWWVLGLSLLMLEIFVSGTFFLWMAIAAGVIGLVTLVIPAISWELQWFLFALLSLTSIALWRMQAKKNPPTTDNPNLNRRSEQYIGRVFTLDSAIINGHGKIVVDDTTWKVRGEDMESGGRVKVSGSDGTVLIVESADLI